jgi:hypothetical protein
MNGQKVLAAEFGISVGILSWIFIKNKYVPWPSVIVASSMSFSVLALLEIIVPGFGAIFGAGMMLVLFVKNSQYIVGKQTITPQKVFGSNPLTGNISLWDNPTSLANSKQGGSGTSPVLRFGQGIPSNPSGGGASPSSFLIGGTGGTTPTTPSTGTSGGNTVTV